MTSKSSAELNPFYPPLQQPLAFDQFIANPKLALDAYSESRKGIEQQLELLRAGKIADAAAALDVLDRVDRDLGSIVGVIHHLESVCSSPELRTTDETLQATHTDFRAKLFSDPTLYQALERLSSQGIASRVQNKFLLDLEASGAKLAAKARERFIEIENRLTEITTKFGQNLLDDTKAWSWSTNKESDIAGLLPSDIDAARESAKLVGESGYRFTLQAPSYRAMVSFNQNRNLREMVARAFSRRASDGARDNSSIVAEVLALRRERASLLGFSSFADGTTSDRMAKSSENVRKFFAELHAPVLASAAKDNERLTAFARAQGFDQPELSAWDVPYYMQKFEEKELGLDPQIIREYFPFEATLEAIFSLVRDVFGVSFSAASLPVWWKEGVHSFKASGYGREFGALYTDYYARDNKRAGAWMDLLSPGMSAGPTGSRNAVGFMAGNFSRPTGSTPALLTHDEVTTLFHEAGHLVHGLVARSPFMRLGMNAVAWDAIEVPSQFFENWAWEPLVLKRITKHYKTGEPMPDQLIQRLVRSRYIMNGLFYARHLANSVLDITLHTTYDAGKEGDPVTFTRKLLKHYVPTVMDDSATINSFHHLFDGPVGYAGGYYSYLWSEAIEADLFSVFAGERAFDARLGAKFVEKVLMPGATDEPEVLLRNFLGRDTNTGALRKRIAGG